MNTPPTLPIAHAPLPPVPSSRQPVPRPRSLGVRTVPQTGKWWGPLFSLFIVLVWAVSFALGFRLALTIVEAVGLLTLAFGLYNPRLGMVGLTILCVIDGPARVYLLTGGVLRWNTLNYFLVLVMLLYLPFLVRLRDRHSVLLMMFVGLLLVDLSITNSLIEGVQQILGIIITFGLLVYFVRAGTDSRMWFWTSTIAGLTGALGGLSWFFQRMQLPAINENAWAMFPCTALFAICLGFPYAVAMKRGQAALLSLAVVNLMWIFLSGSRGTLLIGACCLIVLLLTMRGLRQRTVAIACGAVIIFVAAAHFSQMQERATFRLFKLFTTEEPLSGNYSLSSRTSGRSDLAIGGFYIFEEHPMGVGTGSFKIAWKNLDRHDHMGDYARGELRAAHSGWVKVLAENGALGILLMAAWVGSFAYGALKTRRRVLRRLGLLTSLALFAALLATEFQSKGLWYLAAGATVFLERDSIEAAMFIRRRSPDLRRMARQTPAQGASV
ncbi:MAG TPA: hypothetical protein VLD17_00105 [Gemmatimonadaceae bacterium]|nr:hypothetical protein [Gemmatimonadaceae bacterium]